MSGFPFDSGVIPREPMKLIPLSRGLEAMVDDEDFERLMQWKWSAHRKTSRTILNTYCMRNLPGPPKRTMLMHRFILNATAGFEVDHIDGNSLNNQRSNLRLCTRSQNQKNRTLNRNNSSGFKGVHFIKPPVSRWTARITLNNKRIGLGRFTSAKEAAECYDRAALEHYGDFAKTNKHLGLL